MNQKSLRAPVTAPQGVRNRTAAPYQDVAEGERPEGEGWGINK